MGISATAAIRQRPGRSIDASIVPMPRQTNTREENAAITGGELPEIRAREANLDIGAFSHIMHLQFVRITITLT